VQQAVRVVDGFVAARVDLGATDERRRQAFQVRPMGRNVLRPRGAMAEVVGPRAAHRRAIEARGALEFPSRRGRVRIQHRLVQHLGQDRRPLQVERALSQCGDESRARVTPHHHDPVAVGVELRAVLHDVAKRRLHVVECCRTGVLGRQAVTDRYHQAARVAGQLHAVRVVGVEVPGHEATAVGVHDQWRRSRDRTAVQAQAELLAGRARDGPVFDLHIAGVDGGRPIGGDPVGTLALGGKRLRLEFVDVQAGCGVTQCRVDPADPSGPPGPCAMGLSRHALVLRRC
jgi:hypothetical protein